MDKDELRVAAKAVGLRYLPGTAERDLAEGTLILLDENAALRAAIDSVQPSYPWGQGGMNSDDLYQRGLGKGWSDCVRALDKALGDAS